MESFPMKGINNSENGNFSYVHSVLQSLCCLDIADEILKINFENIPNHWLLSKELYSLIFVVKHGSEGVSDLIVQKFKEYYYNNQEKIESKNVLKEDPFHFLYFFLQFVHLESNCPKNPNFVLPQDDLNNKKNDEHMYNSYINYINQFHNSLISLYFYDLEKYTYKCPQCTQYFSYGMKTVLRISFEEVKEYRSLKKPMKSNQIIDLDDCLNYYSDEKFSTCEFCGNNKIFKKIQLCIPAKVLIFSLERKSHNFFKDINFPVDLDINNYICKERNNNYNTKYKLKSCIYYDNNLEKFFADCYIKYNGTENLYRFIDDQIFIVNNNQSTNYEPQVLIYELVNQNINYSTNSNLPLLNQFNPLNNTNSFLNNLNYTQSNSSASVSSYSNNYQNISSNNNSANINNNFN